MKAFIEYDFLNHDKDPSVRLEEFKKLHSWKNIPSAIKYLYTEPDDLIIHEFQEIFATKSVGGLRRLTVIMLIYEDDHIEYFNCLPESGFVNEFYHAANLIGKNNAWLYRDMAKRLALICVKNGDFLKWIMTQREKEWILVEMVNITENLSELEKIIPTDCETIAVLIHKIDYRNTTKMDWMLKFLIRNSLLDLHNILTFVGNAVNYHEFDYIIKSLMAYIDCNYHEYILQCIYNDKDYIKK